VTAGDEDEVVSVETAPAGAELDMVGERYRLLQRLVAPSSAGPGVWRAQDTVLNRLVMVTVCEPGDPAGRLLMKHAYALTAVEHPSLPRVFDAATEGGRTWLVTEWVEGSTLATLLADGPFDAQEAATSVAQLAEGVALAHRAGLTVGLLDPEHVVVTPRGTVTVTRLAVAGGGTRHDDVRMLGALLYAALTGSLPAPGEPSSAEEGGRLPSPCQVRAGIPAELSTIAMRALDPHRPDPLVDAAALAEALGNWRRTTKPEPFTLDLPAEERYGEAPPRHRRWVPLAAFVSGFCAIALTGLLVNSLVNGGNGGRSPSSSGAEPSHSVVAPGPVSVLTATMYDPAGDGQENPRDAHLAYDGDPGSVWPTLQYRRSAAFGNLKPGVGLIFDLGHPATVRKVTIQTTEPGADLEIRAGDAPDGSLDSYQVVGRAAGIGTTTTVSLPPGTTGRYFVVWITRLVPVGSIFQADLAEVRFLP
jgi:hypothetical protein